MALGFGRWPASRALDLVDFLLSAPHYGYGPAVVGLFGLAGLAGAATARSRVDSPTAVTWRGTLASALAVLGGWGLIGLGESRSSP